jgi:hypothetical protein
MPPVLRLGLEYRGYNDLGYTPEGGPEPEYNIVSDIPAALYTGRARSISQPQFPAHAAFGPLCFSLKKTMLCSQGLGKDQDGADLGRFFGIR